MYECVNHCCNQDPESCFHHGLINCTRYLRPTCHTPVCVWCIHCSTLSATTALITCLPVSAHARSDVLTWHILSLPVQSIAGVLSRRRLNVLLPPTLGLLVGHKYGTRQHPGVSGCSYDANLRNSFFGEVNVNVTAS